MMGRSTHSPATGGRSVLVVGAGGNIGSHFTQHLGRFEEIDRIVLVDPDFYAPHNLFGQAIELADLGQPKVAVQARRLRAVRPDLEVLAVGARVESLPWGLLEADVRTIGEPARRVSSRSSATSSSTRST